MGILKNTIQKQIERNNSQYFEPSSGTILSYDKVNNVASIQFINPYGEGYIRRENVPVSQALGGVTSNGIQPGQKCSLTFTNGNVYAPVITGIISSTFYQKTNKDQGAYLIDSDILDVDIQDSVVPMCNQWIDYDNSNGRKYINQISPYDDFDLIAKYFKMISDMQHYSDTEQGITHFATKSTIKFKDNGDIDILVANNVGVRISQQTQKIYLYGSDVNINGEIDILSVLQKCSKCAFANEYQLKDNENFVFVEIE